MQKKNPINTHFSTKFPPTRLFQPPRLFGILEYLRTYIEHSIVVCSFQTISLWAWKVSAIFVNDAAARASPDQPCCHDRIVQFTRYSNLRVTIVISGDLKTISNSLGWVHAVQLLHNKRVVTKICDWVKCYNRHRSKNIWVKRLSFWQNYVLLGGSFWRSNSLVTLIFFALCLLWYLA